MLVHELCHIYRTEKNHPSHNKELLNRIWHVVLEETKTPRDYEVRVIQRAINHVQDLYADDLSFKVFEDNKLWSKDEVFRFFLT